MEYEEEGGLKRYPALVLTYSSAHGLLVLFDGYEEGDEEGEAFVEDGVDDWDWEDNVKTEAGETDAKIAETGAAAVKMVAGAGAAGAEALEAATPMEVDEQAAQLVHRSTHSRAEASGASKTSSNVGSLHDPPKVRTFVTEPNPTPERLRTFVSEPDRMADASGQTGSVRTFVSGSEELKLEAMATVAEVDGSGEMKLVKGKKRSAVVGKRVVVDYEEEGENGLSEIVRYSGVVLTYSPAHGLLVRYDGYDDDDPEGETWVEEEGVDDWDWEESAVEFAKEAMYLVRRS